MEKVEEESEEEGKDVAQKEMAQTEVDDLLGGMAKRHASMILRPSQRPPSQPKAEAKPPPPPRPKPGALPVSVRLSAHTASSRRDDNMELTLFSDGIFVAKSSFVYEDYADATVWSGTWAGVDSDADVRKLTVEKQSKYRRHVFNFHATEYSETAEKGDVGKTYELLLSAPRWQRSSLERQDCTAIVRRDHRYLFDGASESIVEGPWSD